MKDDELDSEDIKRTSKELLRSKKGWVGRGFSVIKIFLSIELNDLLM